MGRTWAPCRASPSSGATTEATTPTLMEWVEEGEGAPCGVEGAALAVAAAGDGEVSEADPRADITQV